MRVVGLTGGIASGKTSVSEELHRGGLPIVDADKIARAALSKNTSGYKRVVKAFGKNILLPDGEVDRAKLGEIVFADSAKLKQLNNSLGPSIARRLLWEIVKHWIHGTVVLVVDIPLLFETSMDRWTSPVIVVWVDPQTQKSRLIARDGLSEEQAEFRIQSQVSLDWKRDNADIVIDNCGSRDQTKYQVREVLSAINGPLSWKELLLSRNFVAGVVIVTLLSGVCKAWSSAAN